jgi:hypothetical protein
MMARFCGLEIVVSENAPPDCIDIVQPGKLEEVGGRLQWIKRPQLLGRIIRIARKG